LIRVPSASAARLSPPTIALAAAVAVGFADSSIVVLALPDLYEAFGTSIQAIAWVITSYNLVVALVAFALVPFAKRLRPAATTAVGLGIFLVASVGCAAAPTIGVLIGFRCMQGTGAALLLVGSLALLGALERSTARGRAIWIGAGTVGVAIGPALGGVLTELFDWRAIFAAQAPAAALALVATRRARAAPVASGGAPIGRAAAAANLGLGLLFAALAGALFLAVLLAVTVWGLPPALGALAVSALPAAALASRRLEPLVSQRTAVGGGVTLLALGLLALALLPGRHVGLAAAALGLCGAGLGLTLPIVSDAALGQAGAPRATTLSIGARHAGFVLALLLVAPLLAHTLEQDVRRATLAGTAAILDADVPLTTKVPLALDLRNAIARAPRGEVPDLSAPFARRSSDSHVRDLRDTLVGTLTGVLTRSFRTSFALCSLFAALALLPLGRLRRAGS
jgi:predicted MFS family arabinose efflux permease